MAEASHSTLHRNVVVVGKTGAGKSSVCNKLLEEDTFRVAASLDGVTETIGHGEATVKHRGKSYHMKVVDTVGLFDRRYKNKDTIASIKKYFRDIFPDGISLVLFVFSKNRFTEEEQKCLETIINIFHADVSPLSALVITHCDHMKPEKRREYVQQFRSNQHTRRVAAFMKKGIFTAGFPSPDDMDEDEYELAQKKMARDVKDLRDLVCSCGEMRLGKQLVQDSFWDDCAIL